MTISVTDFFKLPKVLSSIEIQKRNRFGSENHRNAHISILSLAKSHGVDQHFESLEDYDS